MSIRLMLSIAGADLCITGIQKSVLNCLAYHYQDDTGLCYPSFNTIAKKCCFSRRSIIRALEQLECMGIISIDKISDLKYGDRPNNYKINEQLIKNYENKTKKLKTPQCHTDTPPVSQ